MVTGLGRLIPYHTWAFGGFHEAGWRLMEAIQKAHLHPRSKCYQIAAVWLVTYTRVVHK